MQVYYDLALGLFLQSTGSYNTLSQITAKRGSNNPISLQFLSNGTPTTLPAGSTLIFSGKPATQYDNNYAVYADSTPGGGWTGPDTNGFYQCLPGYSTALLNSLFGYFGQVDTLPHPDAVQLNGEISWLLPGATIPSKTGPFIIIVYNDVSKGIEGVPLSGAPIYPAPSAIEVIANKGVASGYAPLDGSALLPSVNQTRNGFDETIIGAAGTSILYQGPRVHTHELNVSAGSFAAAVTLAAGTANAGDVKRIHVNMGSGVAQLIIYDGPTGTALGTPIVGFGQPFDAYMEALFKNGTSWKCNFQI